jgi:hypothetical protein
MLMLALDCQTAKVIQEELSPALDTWLDGSCGALPTERGYRPLQSPVSA